jgi:hypothetical protein
MLAGKARVTTRGMRRLLDWRGRRFAVVATWGWAVSLVAACHLFLDPDDLSNGGSLSAPDGGSAGDGGAVADAALDAADDGSPKVEGQVPSCVPQPPDGGQFLAVVGGQPGAVQACPPGYEATGTAGFQGVLDRDFSCTSGTCACGAVVPTGSDCIDIQVRYFQDSQCKTPYGVDPTPVAGCTPLGNAGPTHAELAGTLSPSLTCPPSGAAGIVAQTSRIEREVDLCRPVGPPSGEGCVGTDVPAPPAKDAMACYQAASAECAAGYAASFTFSLDKTLTDHRRCDCTCRPDPDGGCLGGSMDTWLDSTCTSPASTVTGSCHTNADLYGTLASPPTPLEPACVPDSPAKSGDVALAGAPLFLCCLTACDACGRAASATGGACAPSMQACLADAACKDYLLCAQRTGCTSPSCPRCGKPDGGDAAADAVPPAYAGMIACRASACRTECP